MNDNIIWQVSGLAGCDVLDTIYLKGNRLGRSEVGDVEALRGLLERPTLTCLDIQENDLTDPAIVEEILYKLPKIAVLYVSKGNKFNSKISNFRKTMIARIPTLKFLDDRPVFPEDRRRAEAFARGGIEEERKEMKKIKKEKDDAHWANHEAFRIMIKKAQDKKAEEEAAKAEKKETMKDMMKKAREEKAKGNYSYPKEGEEGHEDTDGFFKEVSEIAKQRFEEKQAGIEHSEHVDIHELTDVEKANAENDKKLAEAYDQNKVHQAKANEESLDRYAKMHS